MNIGTLELGVELSGADGLTDGFDGMGDSFEETGEQADETGGLIEGLSTGTEALEGASDLASGGLRRLSNWMGITAISTAKFSAVITGLTGAITTLAGYLSGAATALAGIVSGVSASTVAIAALIAVIAGLILELTGITDVTRVNMEWLKKWLGVAYNVAAGFVNDAVNWIIDGLYSIIDTVENALVNAFKSFKKTVFSIFDSIKSEVESVFEKIVNSFKKHTNNLMGGFNKVIDKVTEVNNIGKHEVKSDVSGNLAKQEAKTVSKTNKESKTENKVEKIEVNFDERVDLSDMNPRDKRELAEMIGEESGKKFDRKTN